jgi:stage II sporulation protein D
MGWIGGLFLIVGFSPAQADHQLRVGLFGLYQAQSVMIQAVGHSPVVLQGNGQREHWYLQPRSRLEIKRQGEQLQFSLVGTNPPAGRSQSATQLNLGWAAPSDSSAWRVTIDNGRLVRTLRGDLQVRIADGAIQMVLETDLESLVARVVASEMSGITELEALKSLAVVARTFVRASRSRHRSEGFDFCDTTHCQWYQAEDRLDRQDRFARLVKQAVTETESLTLAFHGTMRPTYFTGSCGGMTTPPELIWSNGTAHDASEHQPIACQWCRQSKFYGWERRVRKLAFMAVVSELIGARLSPKAEIVAEINEQGFVPAVWVVDGQRRIRLRGDVLRSHVGRQLGWNWILSNAYTIEERDGWLVFRGRGFGHNVGLCLSGAAAQARAGRLYEVILKYYFPAAQLIKL